MKRTHHLITALLLSLALPFAALAAPQDIRFESRAEIEVQQTLADGTKTWVRQPATLVVPGQVVVYTNRYTNQGDAPADNLVVTNPVPENMAYLDGSAFPEAATITFSVDGGQTFAAPDKLTVTGPDGSPRPAEASDYTHIRWRLQGTLPPGASDHVEFRARLK